MRNNSFKRKVTLSQYFEKELLEDTLAEERLQESIYDTNINDHSEEEEIDIYTSYASYMSSSDPGSDNLIVTFDYGFHDSLETDFSLNSKELDSGDLDIEDKDSEKSLFRIPEEESTENSQHKLESQDMISKSPNIFRVHQVVHKNQTLSSSPSCISMASSYVDYNIDTSGDYGSWAQQSESEGDVEENTKPYRNYRYEDLIKNEVHIFNDNSDNDDNNNDDDVNKDVNRSEVLINFNFNEDQPPPIWFNNNFNTIANTNNEPLYYRSVDYLN